MSANLLKTKQSQCLRDPGEEAWPVKLHLGCGGVYLRGYVNIDAQGRYAGECNGDLSRNETDIDDYYAGLDGSATNLPRRRPNVVDVIADITATGYQPDSVDKILAVQVFEHLSPVHAVKALQHWHTILKRWHPLVMSVPDLQGTLDMVHTDPDFVVRHLVGRRGDYLNTHHAWYTRETLRELLEYHGFKVEPLPNFHFYPAIVVRAVKQ